MELESVLALCQAGHLVPCVDCAYPFADAARAHRWISEQRKAGKVLLTL